MIVWGVDHPFDYQLGPNNYCWLLGFVSDNDKEGEVYIFAFETSEFIQGFISMCNAFHIKSI